MKYKFKICSKCGKRKPIDQFGISKRDGVRAQCKICRRRYYYKNHEENKEKCRQYYKKNKEKILKYNKEYREKNKEKIKLKNHFKYIEYSEEVNEKRREYFKKYREKVGNSILRNRQKISIAKKPEQYRALQRKHDRLKRRDPKFRISVNMSRTIRRSIKNKKGSKWEDIVGYTLKALIVHLENQFDSGMSWDNYGEWHIDHKIPLAVFNFKSKNDIDFKKAWALDNLQPLWRLENQTKHKKISKPFQPSFSFYTDE